MRVWGVTPNERCLEYTVGPLPAYYERALRMQVGNGFYPECAVRAYIREALCGSA